MKRGTHWRIAILNAPLNYPRGSWWAESFDDRAAWYARLLREAPRIIPSRMAGAVKPITVAT